MNINMAKKKQDNSMAIDELVAEACAKFKHQIAKEMKKSKKKGKGGHEISHEKPEVKSNGYDKDGYLVINV